MLQVELNVTIFSGQGVLSEIHKMEQQREGDIQTCGQQGKLVNIVIAIRTCDSKNNLVNMLIQG